MSAMESVIELADRAMRKRRLNEALILFDRAERAVADANRCAAGRWMAHMLLGDFERAWLESDGMRERGAVDPHRLWQGESLQGKQVMVRSLHGFGDALQFLRYVPHLRKIASRVIVEVAPRFVEMAACLCGVDEVITWGEDAPAQEPPWDAQIEIMELPYYFRTQVSDLPIAKRYLKMPEQPALETMERVDCLQVGLVWAAGEWNMARSIPASMLTPLLELDGCRFWNLQPYGNEPDQSGLASDESCRSSIVGLAARISKLDLVITVDTLAAHLAGALGIPAWLLLQYEADWRWMHDREDSPWYPSLLLFRQPEAGDWSSVMKAVSNSLRHRAREFLEQKQVA